MSQYSFDEDSSYYVNPTDSILGAMLYRLPRKRMDLSSLNTQTLREVQQAAHVAHLMNARARRESRHFEHPLAVYEIFPQGNRDDLYHEHSMAGHWFITEEQEKTISEARYGNFKHESLAPFIDAVQAVFRSWKLTDAAGRPLSGNTADDPVFCDELGQLVSSYGLLLLPREAEAVDYLVGRCCVDEDRQERWVAARRAGRVDMEAVLSELFDARVVFRSMALAASAAGFKKLSGVTLRDVIEVTDEAVRKGA